ncbi:MAG: hypothetical protein ACREHD_14535, partial [Pirellulales bacterium]
VNNQSDNGQLQLPAGQTALSFNLTSNKYGQVTVNLSQSATANNTSLDNLVSELNSQALAGTTLGRQVTAQNDNGQIAFVASPASGITSLTISGASDLGFNDGQNSSADVMITLRDGTTFPVSFKGLTASSTLGPVNGGGTNDVIDVIETAAQAAEKAQQGNNAIASPLTVKIGDPSNPRGLTLTDNTGGTGSLTVTAANESLAGGAQTGLGIIGSDDAGNGIILGAPLDGDSIAQHVFIRDASAKASVTLSGNFAATATLGIVGIGISGGTASGAVNAAISVAPTGTPADNGRINLAGLFAPGATPAYTATPSLSGNASLVLPSQLTSSVLKVPANTPLTTLTVNWPDITNVGTLSLADAVRA